MNKIDKNNRTIEETINDMKFTADKSFSELSNRLDELKSAIYAYYDNEVKGL